MALGPHLQDLMHVRAVSDLVLEDSQYGRAEAYYGEVLKLAQNISMPLSGLIAGELVANCSCLVGVYPTGNASLSCGEQWRARS